MDQKRSREFNELMNRLTLQCANQSTRSILNHHSLRRLELSGIEFQEINSTSLAQVQFNAEMTIVPLRLEQDTTVH